MLNWNQRKSAKNHILKKIIILDLWDGKCTNCGFGISIANIDNLPALEIHHEYSELKVNMFSNFIKSTNAYREIIDMIFEEKCTCLCRNCHVMVQSTFFNEKEVDIFKKYKSKFC